MDNQTPPPEPSAADVQAAIATLCEGVPGFAETVLRMAAAILGADDDPAPAESKNDE